VAARAIDDNISLAKFPRRIGGITGQRSFAPNVLIAHAR